MQTYNTSFSSYDWKNYQKALKEVATLRERNKKLNKKLKELRKEIKELKELASKYGAILFTLIMQRRINKMAKITLEKKYFHDYNNPTETDKYNIEHDQSGSMETIEVDSVEELLKRILTEYTSQGYDIRTFEMRLNKGIKNTEEWVVNSEMVKIKVAVK